LEFSADQLLVNSQPINAQLIRNFRTISFLQTPQQLYEAQQHRQGHGLLLQAAGAALREALVQPVLVELMVNAPDGRELPLRLRRGQQHDLHQLVADFVTTMRIDARWTAGQQKSEGRATLSGMDGLDVDPAAREARQRQQGMNRVVEKESSGGGGAEWRGGGW
jgi:hypothetical protein